MYFVIHHHFRFLRAFLENPCRFNKVAFESIPFFQLYGWRDLKIARDSIDKLSDEGMPWSLQEIIKQLTPAPHIAQSQHREELINLRYCTHNRQGLFARAYRLRAKNFFKVEITFHSDTMQGKGKYLNLERAIRSAERVFGFLDKNISPIHPLGRHLDEYFFIEDFRKKVGVFEKELSYLKQVENRRVREDIKEKLHKEAQSFEKEAKEIAKEKLLSLKRNDAVRANLCDSRQLESGNK
jgi:hypothetical protein